MGVSTCFSHYIEAISITAYTSFSIDLLTSIGPCDHSAVPNSKLPSQKPIWIRLQQPHTMSMLCKDSPIIHTYAGVDGNLQP